MAVKPRAVFDTNIYVSAIIYGGAPRLCLELAQKKKVELYVSKAILLELVKILGQKFGYPKIKAEEVIGGLIDIAGLVESKEKVALIKQDPADNIILEAALATKADFIVTGDRRHILPIKKFRGIKIVTVAEFLKMI